MAEAVFSWGANAHGELGVAHCDPVIFPQEQAQSVEDDDGGEGKGMQQLASRSAGSERRP